MRFTKFLKLIPLLALLIPSIAFGASTITGAESLNQGLSGRWEVRRIVYTVTCHTDGSFTTTTLNNINDSQSRSLKTVEGWWLIRVDTYATTTDPDDDTDLYLYMDSTRAGYSVDILGGRGVNQIDANTTNASNTLYPATTSQPLTGAEQIAISGNTVNTAIFEIVFTLYR